MTTGAKVLFLPGPEEKLTYHIAFPSVIQTLASAEHDGDSTASGLSGVAAAMQEVSQKFDKLSAIFDEYPGLTYTDATLFVDGRYVFEFQVHRRYRTYLSEMGFEPVEEGT